MTFNVRMNSVGRVIKPALEAPVGVAWSVKDMYLSKQFDATILRNLFVYIIGFVAILLIINIIISTAMSIKDPNPANSNILAVGDAQRAVISSGTPITASPSMIDIASASASSAATSASASASSAASSAATSASASASSAATSATRSATASASSYAPGALGGSAGFKDYTEGFTSPLTSQNTLRSLLQNVPKNQQFLVNLCPLTASIGGYIGPLKGGVFDPAFYVTAALNAGIRSFVLPISTYTDDNKRPPNWPVSGDPAIVCRDANGVVQSLNGISVKQFCSELVRYLGVNGSQMSEPVLLFINQVTAYLPDPVKDEASYVRVTHKIAKDLSVINSYRLTSAGVNGSATGGQNEAAILTQMSISDLNSKIIIFTNFNTKIALKSAYSKMLPTLDEYSNFIYKPVNAANSATAAATGSRNILLTDVSGSQVNWTEQARIVWHIAFASGTDPNAVPTANLVDQATNTGIQTVPIPFFYTDLSGTQPIWDLWGGYAWRVKPDAARYTMPDPIVPATPSEKMNARVRPNLQPGQTAVD